MCNGVQVFFDCNHWEGTMTKRCEFADSPSCAIVVWDRVEQRNGKCRTCFWNLESNTQTIYVASDIAVPYTEMKQRSADKIKEEPKAKVEPEAKVKPEVNEEPQWL
jgi:hypothetical protein